MKKKKILSWVLSVVVGISMSFAGVGTVFADTGAISKSVQTNNIKANNSVLSINSGTYSLKLVKAGTIYLYGEANSFVDVVSPNGNTSYIYLGSDGIGAKHYNIAGTYVLKGAIDTAKSGTALDPAKGQRLVAGKTYLFGNTGQAVNTFTFKATKTGYLAIQKDKGLSCKYSLWLGNKKVANADSAYSSTTESSNKALVYGVTKGKTYRIQVAPSFMEDYSYALKLTNKRVKETSGKKQKKAKKLKKKRTYKGTVQAGSSKGDWYKFKPKKKNSKLIITVHSGSEIKAQIFCKGSGKTVKYVRTLSGPSWKYTIPLYNSKKSATWYVKIYRANKYSSGYYTIKWK